MHRQALKYRRLLLRSFFPVLRCLPADSAARMVTRIGLTEYSLLPAFRNRLQELVERAALYFEESWDTPKVAAQLAGNQVRWRARDLLLEGRNAEELSRVFQVDGADHLRSAVNQNRGVILLGNHFGAHLMPALWAMQQGYSMRLFMERPHHVSSTLAKEFDTEGPLGQKDLFISRKAGPTESARSILRASRILKSGFTVFIAGDVRWQDKHSVPVNFLGRPCRISTTWLTLAALSGAPVVTTFCRMKEDGGHQLSFLPAFQVPADTIASGGTLPLVQAFLSELETQIRLDPTNSNEYFFWSEKDDPAYARHRLRDEPIEVKNSERVAA